MGERRGGKLKMNMKTRGVRRFKKLKKKKNWVFGFEEGSRLYLRLRKKMNFNGWFLIYPSIRDSKVELFCSPLALIGVFL